MSNRLASATSPYLRQHADNPVDWYPWGPEAFAEARCRDVPVMVSIGYSSCHWCHVMARESFSNPEIAALLNDHVVAIKVDREELPAVDSYYMNALQAFRSQGGWPLTAFTDHDGVPFFSGTYYPPEPRQGIPSLPQVVTAVAKTWREERGQVQQITGTLGPRLEELADVSQLAGASDLPEVPGLADLQAYVDSLESAADFNNGGFGTAPKFPPFPALRLLVRYAWIARSGEAAPGPSGDAGSGPGSGAGDDASSSSDSGPGSDSTANDEGPGTPDATALSLARRTFLSLATGGIRDHLRGGLFRYSVDAKWQVPHFEKMLGDNAMYLEALSDWYRLERRIHPGSVWTALAKREALATGNFLLRDMRIGTTGGFATALDADSETFDPMYGLQSVHREGAYYTFSSDEFSQALHASGVQPEQTSLRLLFSEFTEDLPGGVLLREPAAYDPRNDGGGPTDASVPASPDERLLSRLHTYQDSRPAPARDDKFVLELGGLTAAALFRAGLVFAEHAFITTATDTLRLLRSLPPVRSVAADLTPGPGAAGLVDLLALIKAELAAEAAAVATGEVAPDDQADTQPIQPDWQRVSRLWADVLDHFVETPEVGALRVFDTLPEPLLGVRHADPIDQITPAGRSALAEVALLLQELAPVDSGITVPTGLLDALLAQGVPLMQQSPTGAGYLAYVAALAADPVRVETGDGELFQAAAQHPAPVALTFSGTESAVELHDHAQICRGNVCSLPLADTTALVNRLDAGD